MAMADSDRIVYPDEFSAIQAAAAAARATTATTATTTEAQKKTEAGDTNTVEVVPPGVTSRNLVQVPANCPDGFQMGADGRCREVFN